MWLGECFLASVLKLQENRPAGPERSAVHVSELSAGVLMFLRAVRTLLLALCAEPCLSQSIITTVAGTDFVFPRASIPALGAPIGNVGGVAVDSGGNLFLTDSYRHLVLKISPDGKLIVVAGNGIQGLSGDGGNATGASLNT